MISFVPIFARIALLPVLFSTFTPATDPNLPVTFSDDARSSQIKLYTLIVTQSPADATGVIGGQAVFSAAFQTNSPGSVTYNWQVQTDGATWANLVETTGFYEGVTTTTLTVKAIDNFLATRASLNFRCQGLYNNAVATYTAAAALSIPIHTDWTPGYATAAGPVAGLASTVAGTASLPIAAPVVSGFAGPYTYLWTKTGGSGHFACADPTDAAPTITCNPVSPTDNSTWICTITNGTATVATDPIAIYAFGVSPTALPLSHLATPGSQNGAALTVTFGGATGFFWTVTQNVSFRCAANAVAINSPNAMQTTFGLGAGLPGGCAAGALMYCAYNVGAQHARQGFFTYWLGPVGSF